MTLGEQLKKLRAEKGLSQPELAELASIEQSYLSKLENDKSLPSNEVFRKLLSALSLSVVQVLEPLDKNYIKNNLLVISDIEQLYQQASTKQLNQQRNLLYMASTFVIVAVTLFYIGYSKHIFNESLYEYHSRGVVLAGEPINIFSRWRELIDIKDRNEKDEVIRKKRVVMASRSDTLVHLSTENQGSSFVMAVTGGKRLFYKSKESPTLQKPRMINAWLQVLGVLLFCSGIISFVLERRLYNLQR